MSSNDVYHVTGGILGIAVLIFDIIAIFEVFNSDRDVPSKFVWALFIIMFPVLGLFVYFAFAKRSHSGYASII
jgi:hypothetical protein